MIAKNTTLAVAIVCGFSLSAKAEDIKTYETLQVSCNPFASNSVNSQCSSNSSVESEADLIAQNRRGRGRRRKSKVQGYYAGFSLGAGFPSGEVSISESGELTLGDNNISTNFDFDPGINGSVFGGLNFNKNLGAELEFLLGFGSADTDDFNQGVDDAFGDLREQSAQFQAIDFTGGIETDVDYSAFALYASPKFNLPISNRFNLFLSPGIGLSQTNVNYEADSDLRFARTQGTGDPELDAELDSLEAEFDGLNDEINTDRDSSKTGISFQIKAGASFQISETIGLFGQLRYVTLPTESNDEFETDSLNSFATQAGLTFNF